MASLRARLVVGVVALSAAGLLLLGGITYAEQRSFLLDRVDVQARSAVPFMSRELDEDGVAKAHGGASSGGGAGFGPGQGGRFGPPPDENAALPPGTYGQRRDADGTVLGDTATSTLGDEELAKPDLPADMTAGELITVGAQGDSSLRYRAIAQPDSRDGGTIVVAVPLTEVDATLDRLLVVSALVIAAVLIALGVLSWVVVRIGLRPLDRIGATAGAIAAGDLSRRVSPATSRTEVGRLGLALNAMLGRLEQAFAERQASEDRLRRFLADASHELRTPLASIRGYAELFRIGAARDPAGTEKAMSRIEGEAARMGVLVEDLLTLARMDEVRELVREDIDAGALASDAVDDARATAPDRDIAVHVEPPAHVRGDPHQLRQVLANLLRNALVHTPAGTPIEVHVSGKGGEVLLEVRDHGPGLPGEDPQALFERFWRAEGGRERGRAGAGLGLAIVAAIVDAHEGRVRAENAPDGGARFVVALPAPAPARRSAAGEPTLRA